MDRKEIEAIFQQQKEKILEDISSSTTTPIAYIFGGQPAVGKSNLCSLALTDTPNLLNINGDDYRCFHPNYHTLVQDPLSFPGKTQDFSNVFTEGLINEAIVKKFNVSIEGTMRRAEIVLKTVEKLHNEGFKIEALCISAPLEYSEINSYDRYITSLAFGPARLADMSSLKEAYEGIPKTLDALHQQGIVDKIRIFNIYAQQEIKKYTLISPGKYNDNLTPPSLIINQSRLNQLHNPELLNFHLNKAKKVSDKIATNAPSLSSSFRPYLMKIISIANQSLKNIDLEK